VDYVTRIRSRGNNRRPCRLAPDQTIFHTATLGGSGGVNRNPKNSRLSEPWRII
jgi:hypothetical protein